MFKTIVRDNVALAEAPIKGKNVFDNFSYTLVECLALVELSNNNAANTQVRVQAFLNNLNDSFCDKVFKTIVRDNEMCIRDSCKDLFS